MAAVSTRRTTTSGPVLRSHSPSGRLPFASSTTTFTTGTTFFQNQSSLHTHKPSSPSSSVRFSFDNRPISPNKSISNNNNKNSHATHQQLHTPKKTCMCSPTSHPGSFRCSLHKKIDNTNTRSINTSNCSTSSCGSNNYDRTTVVTCSSNSLNARRSAMTNSLVRIGTVEGGDLVKRALAAMIRPSSHQQKRRAAFRPKPSRLSVMSKAEDS